MVTARNYPDYFPYAVSVAVRNLEYAADVNIGLPYVCNLGAPLALSTTGLLVTGALTTGVVQTFTLVSTVPILLGGLVPHDSLTKRGGWGRGLTFVADAACTRTITVDGYDYLGQLMRWTGTVNGTTPVPCPKAFQWLTSISFGASADVVSISVGYNNVFGLPYTLVQSIAENKNYAVAANAGTFTAGLVEGTAATATNADVRGTYLPATVIPDGTNIFEVIYEPRRGNYHGAAQFSA